MESEGGESNWAPFITVTLDAIDTFVIVFFTLEYSIRFGKQDENDCILHNKPKECTTISPSFLSETWIALTQICKVPPAVRLLF